MKLSIVIPVYNVEPYIEKCIKSVLTQNIGANDYEIIIVNDGTPDRSMSIIDAIVKDAPNVHIISQQNQGLSVARNNGLVKARGEYVWFVDSDDWIEPNCLLGICSLLDGKLDLLQIQYRYTFDDPEKKIDAQICSIKESISGKEQLRRGGVDVPVPFSIYRRKFLEENNLKCYPGMLHEDGEFKPRALYLAKTCRSYDKIVYNYYQRSSGSITVDFKLKNALDLFIQIGNLLQFTETQKMPYKYRICFYRSVGVAMNYLLARFNKLSPENQLIVHRKLEVNKRIFKYIFQSYELKYMFESILFGININFGLWAYNIVKNR